MANQTIARCIWLVDTIRRYGRITRRQLEDAWERSHLSNGTKLSRRTFCSHRDMAEELFNVIIECDPLTYEYYIAEGENRDSVAEWLLDSVALNEVLAGARDISDRIFVENVPSAREHLSTVIDAVRHRHPVKFDYHPYTRSLPTLDVIVEPYFLKLFKQRWYMVGRVVSEKKIKTYALDRVRNVSILSETFEEDENFNIGDYFKYSYGIVVNNSEPKKVVLRTTIRRAKYLRALPFHHTQTETVSDSFSIFTYKMHITDDFVAELLSYGPDITVLEPPELRTIIKTSLETSLANYSATEIIQC